MKYLNKTLSHFDEGVDILSNSIKIKQKQKTNPNLINATIGTLYDEDRKISVLNVVKEVQSSLDVNEIYPYSATQGPEGFDKALIKFLFKNYENEVRSKKHFGVIPTPGATGALNTSLFMCLNENDTVILPTICWNVYFNMAKTMNFKYVEYDYIKDNHFDLQGFIRCVEEVSKTQKNIVTILNDPCNNPTSYSLSKEEFKSLIDYMNSRKDLSFTLIYDIAYYEYSKQDSREKFSMLKDLADNVLTIITWSASKTFTMYGLRLGAMIIMDSNKEITDNFTNIARCVSRTKWSCVSTSSLNMIYKIISDDKKVEEATKEIRLLNEMLYKRASLFITQAQENNLEIIPYCGGFFIAISFKDPSLLAKKLEERDIYVIPFNKVIRIAICGMTYNQCDGLAKQVKECIDLISN